MISYNHVGWQVLETVSSQYFWDFPKIGRLLKFWDNVQPSKQNKRFNIFCVSILYYIYVTLNYTRIWKIIEYFKTVN